MTHGGGTSCLDADNDARCRFAPAQVVRHDGVLLGLLQDDPRLRDGDARQGKRLPPRVLRLPAVQPQVRVGLEVHGEVQRGTGETWTCVGFRSQNKRSTVPRGTRGCKCLQLFTCQSTRRIGCGAQEYACRYRTRNVTPTSKHTTLNLCALHLQVLRGGPLLPVRQQDPLRVRLRRAHGFRQYVLQLQRATPDQETGAEPGQRRGQLGLREPQPQRVVVGRQGRGVGGGRGRSRNGWGGVSVSGENTLVPERKGQTATCSSK